MCVLWLIMIVAFFFPTGKAEAGIPRAASSKSLSGKNSRAPSRQASLKAPSAALDVPVCLLPSDKKEDRARRVRLAEIFCLGEMKIELV